jgi:hypothetical protein
MNPATPYKASVQGALEFWDRVAGRLFVPTVSAVAVVLSLTFMGCSSSAPRFRTGANSETSTVAPRGPGKSHRYPEVTPAGIDRDRFLLDVVGYLGVPYEYGGTSKVGIDCSGFTMRVYQSAMATRLPRSAAEQFRFGRKVKVDSLMFGDLLFFNTTGDTPSHVGIFIEDGIFAHASLMNGVTLSSIENQYYRDRFVGARRVAR